MSDTVTPVGRQVKGPPVDPSTPRLSLPAHRLQHGAVTFENSETSDFLFDRTSA